jgi:hypothetical protein
MPIQKKKKKKVAKEKSKPAVSQKVSQIVKINIGDVKPKPRRRKAPAKKKEAAPFSFGGGGGGGGLAQVVQAPQATQDVLQQSKELREIVNKLQTSPAQKTLRGEEAGGQPENPLAPQQFVTQQEKEAFQKEKDDFYQGQQAVVQKEMEKMKRAQEEAYKEASILQQNVYEKFAVAAAEREDEEAQLSSQTGELNAEQPGPLTAASVSQAVRVNTHALDTNVPHAASFLQVNEPQDEAVGQLVENAGRRRGQSYSEDQREQIRRDVAESGMSISAYNLSGRNPFGSGPIPVSTLNYLFRGMGGLSGYKQRLGD